MAKIVAHPMLSIKQTEKIRTLIALKIDKARTGMVSQSYNEEIKKIEPDKSKK
jgi:hypothetical protein